jgi:signal transduction histidine kinase
MKSATDDGFDAGRAVLETVDSGISLAIVVAVCAAAVRSGERQEKTRALLAELRAAHAELESAHAELERRAAKVRELSVAEERARMAREVHDSVGHHLTVINLHLENAVGLATNPRVEHRIGTPVGSHKPG